MDEKPQTSELRVLFYHYISRSSIYINFFFEFELILTYFVSLFNRKVDV